MKDDARCTSSLMAMCRYGSWRSSYKRKLGEIQCDSLKYLIILTRNACIVNDGLFQLFYSFNNFTKSGILIHTPVNTITQLVTEIHATIGKQ